VIEIWQSSWMVFECAQYSRLQDDGRGHWKKREDLVGREKLRKSFVIIFFQGDVGSRIAEGVGKKVYGRTKGDLRRGVWV